MQRCQDIVAVGIPIVLCNPNPGYRSNGRGDVIPPTGWQHAEPDLRVLDQYRPGHHTLAMVTGRGVDVVDLDLKTGVDLADLPLGHELGMDTTPGGGWHLPVPSTGYGRAALRLGGKVAGDYLGGVEGGAARGLCYLPGSYRPKYPDVDYLAHTEWDIDKLIDSEPDPMLLTILDASGVSRSPRESRSGGQPGDIAAFLEAHQSTASCRYGDRALVGLLAESETVAEGGRHGWAVRATARAVELILSGCLDLRALTTVRDRLNTLKPEGQEFEFTEVVQWAVANAEPDTSCTGHRSAAVTTAGGDWDEMDLGQVLDNPTRPVPSLMTRTDGVSLLYPGLVHSLSGESESFKSGVMQWETVCLLARGEPVLYIDFESDPHSVIERLTSMGATTQQIRDHFHYVRPNSGFQPTHLDRLGDRPYRLAVIDGVTEALSLSGGDTNSADSVARLYQQLPHQIATRYGAAVVLIDHVSKSRETRGRFSIGSQHKLAAISGAAYLLEPKTPLARESRGSLLLKIAKDRPGVVRQSCSGFDASDRTQAAATIIVDSVGDTLALTYTPPAAITPPPHLLAQVSGWLARQGRPVTSAEATATFRDRSLPDVLAALALGGFVTADGSPPKYTHQQHFVAGVDQIQMREG